MEHTYEPSAIDQSQDGNIVLSHLLYITNPFDDDYLAEWNGNQYLLKSQKMTPVVVGDPIQNQNIRKLWALKMCKLQLSKDKKFRKQMPTEYDLAPLMEKCLKPLEKVEPVMKVGKKSQSEMNQLAQAASVLKPLEESNVEQTIKQGRVII